MSIKHGTLALPSGITATGTLLHQLTVRIEDVNHEAMSATGAFQEGKSIRKRTSLSMQGEALSTLALPTVGAGVGSAASPHIDSTELTEKNEGAADFAIEAHYYAAGAGDFA